ncbi:LOW QUALITY PROTEIN: hypothetical protein Dda_3790 [Drechslerella dactyloides]|uniref:MICOS complex subunit n=1 Tax=Drechslerella dactyloides TaxID=74499 RepID=A0AAD6IYM1_DREDA|nr:LOW QUALITY PROTEIN: hypothetical protein Dda_3790 [Drechslerella dactyloides]
MKSTYGITTTVVSSPPRYRFPSPSSQYPFAPTSNSVARTAHRRHRTSARRSAVTIGVVDRKLPQDRHTHPLVIHHAQIYVRVEFLSRDPTVHWLVAVIIVPRRAQLVAEIVDGGIVLIKLEGRAVLREAVQRASFARHALDKHADGHTRRESVRVDDDVRLYAGLREGHVDGRPLLRADALLPVSRGELVADDRRPRDPELDADRLADCVADVVAEHPYFLDVRVFRAFVFEEKGLARAHVMVDGNGIALNDLLSDHREAVRVIDRAAVFVPHSLELGQSLLVGTYWRPAVAERQLRDLGLRFLPEVVFLRLVDGTVSESALVRRLVDNHGVVHVVAGVCDDGNDGVHPVGKVVQAVLYRGALTTGDWPVCSLYILLSVRCRIAVPGVPIVCLPIWHWYMFLGLWLKSEKGVMLATMERMFVGSNSTCVSPDLISGSVTAILRNGCSKGPTKSSLSSGMYLTGRIMRASCEKRYTPGYCPEFDTGTYPISRSLGTLQSATRRASLGEHQPSIFPSSWTARVASAGTGNILAEWTPSVNTSGPMWLQSNVVVATLHLCARWFSKPQGEPSGDLRVQEPAEQDLLVLRRVDIVRRAGARHQRVQLLDHEQQLPKLIPVVLKMYQHDLAQEQLADLHIRYIGADLHHDPELVAQIRQRLVPRVETLHPVRQKGILPLIEPDDALKDLPVVRVHERLEYHHDGDEILAFPPREAEGDVAVVAAVDDEHADELFVTADDKVAAELFGLFLVLDEVFWRHALQVASVAHDHQREETAVSVFLLPFAIVDFIVELELQLAAVGDVSFPALECSDVSVSVIGDSGGGVVAAAVPLPGSESPEIGHTRQLVPVAVLFVAVQLVEDGLLANVLNRLGREGGFIGWWVAKSLFAVDGIEDGLARRRAGDDRLLRRRHCGAVDKAVCAIVNATAARASVARGCWKRGIEGGTVEDVEELQGSVPPNNFSVHRVAADAKTSALHAKRTGTGSLLSPFHRLSEYLVRSSTTTTTITSCQTSLTRSTMAARLLLKPGAAALGAASLAGFATISTVLAEEPININKKSIYDDYPPPTPHRHNLALPAPDSSSSTDTTPAPHHRATPTERLATEIGTGRRALYTQVVKVQRSLDDLFDRYLHIEHTVTTTIADIAPSQRSGETVIPGVLFVAISAMAGSVLARRRMFPLRVLAPVVTGVAASWYFLPETTRNVADLAWRWEQKVPAVAEAHLATRRGVEDGWSAATGTYRQARETVEESTAKARRTIEGWVRNSK